jgi:hypothetical protein
MFNRLGMLLLGTQVKDKLEQYHFVHVLDISDRRLEASLFQI